MTNIENDTPVDDGATEETAAPEAVAAEPQDEAAKLAEQIAALQQDLLYARAETQNVTRRKDKEIADAHAYASTKFARDILSVADNLGRALAALTAEQREDAAIKPLIIGLEATERELLSVFERNGITRIAAIGLPLDPNQHQAMLEIPSDKEPGTIVQEMQAGYMMKDRLLRPAMVGVAKKAD
ncbi:MULTISPECIES: nucleotide exchange factor GrpE [unclassified Sphingopyxis]|uniref:nucleotide exchange factor GrpE n=1 Tax=unclassified Sphingopyxis TaxID=2614943 RepID=UPI000730529D|nr:MULTISPECIES: nucleotide exchange factor GrpE [unclassified Sphingopyxis]KTE26461.1 molecular chaperone GrpE [Sphingopyxis sp. H057]KTE52866.1 molecular chaperone GrpE [Sphingopyxis sp. H073]KTE55054.1 molecular chaperone GrpE [Sphingopyxis sp. H071]KTE62516.1 molecular chaperone GrpE [Sphingopyxis sp. H107]KTE66061.1 molecular chaperone GrpE [Sphingopyxis sp. H100]